MVLLLYLFSSAYAWGGGVLGPDQPPFPYPGVVGTYAVLANGYPGLLTFTSSGHTVQGTISFQNSQLSSNSAPGGDESLTDLSFSKPYDAVIVQYTRSKWNQFFKGVFDHSYNNINGYFSAGSGSYSFDATRTDLNSPVVVIPPMYFNTKILRDTYTGTLAFFQSSLELASALLPMFETTPQPPLCCTGYEFEYFQWFQFYNTIYFSFSRSPPDPTSDPPIGGIPNAPIPITGRESYYGMLDMSAKNFHGHYSKQDNLTYGFDGTVDTVVLPLDGYGTVNLMGAWDTSSSCRIIFTFQNTDTMTCGNTPITLTDVRTEKTDAGYYIRFYCPSSAGGGIQFPGTWYWGIFDTTGKTLHGHTYTLFFGTTLQAKFHAVKSS